MRGRTVGAIASAGLCTDPLPVPGWPRDRWRSATRQDVEHLVDGQGNATQKTRGKPGGQRIYANIAIEAALTLRMIFHLPLRQTEGFLRSLADLLEVELPIPDHTTLSRRLKKLGEIPFRGALADRPIHLLIDSTGLRVHVGHLRKPPKRRAWRKLHLAVDADTGEIVASDLTGRRTHDCARIPVLLEQIDDPVAPVSADGAYDAVGVYEAAREKGGGRAVRVLIPPGRDAQVSPRLSAALKERNRNIRSIQ